MNDVRVRIAPSEEDFTKFVCEISAHNQLRCFALTGLSYFVSFIITHFLLDFIGTFSFYGHIPPIMRDLSWVSCFLLFYFLIWCFFQHYVSVQYLHPSGSFLRPKEIIIDEEGIRETSNVHTAFSQWIGVIKIEESEHLILIYVDQMAAYVFPKRAFQTSGEAKAFVEQAQMFWNSAKTHAPNKGNQAKSPWGMPRVTTTQATAEGEEKGQ